MPKYVYLTLVDPRLAWFTEAFQKHVFATGIGLLCQQILSCLTWKFHSMYSPKKCRQTLSFWGVVWARDYRLGVKELGVVEFCVAKFALWMTAQAKRRRLDTDSLVEITISVVSFSPFRATLCLLQWIRFTKKYLADCSAKLSKGLLHGHFRHDAVAVFRYSSMDGWRSTSTTQHSVPILRQRFV